MLKSSGLRAVFQLVGAASIEVHGFYSRAANMQSSVSASPVKVVWHMCNESAIRHCECCKVVQSVNL